MYQIYKFHVPRDRDFLSRAWPYFNDKEGSKILVCFHDLWGQDSCARVWHIIQIGKVHYSPLFPGVDQTNHKFIVLVILVYTECFVRHMNTGT